MSRGWIRLHVTPKDEAEGATVERQTDRACQRRQDRAEAKGQGRRQIPRKVQPGPRDADEPKSREGEQSRSEDEHPQQEGRQGRRQVTEGFSLEIEEPTS